MKALTTVGLLISLFLLSGCMARYKDISTDDRYHHLAHLVGQQYELLSPLRIYGVRGYYDNEKVIVYFVSYTGGSSGPEVIVRDKLKAGTLFKITKILLCTNCLFDEIIEYRINILSESPYKDVAAPVDLRNEKNDIVITDPEGKVTLNPAVFKLLQ